MFKSLTDEVRYLAKELLKDGHEHRASEIEKYVKARSLRGSDVKRGLFANALRKLVEEDTNYEIIKRGVYKQVSIPQNEEVANESIQIEKKDNKEMYLSNINIIFEESINKVKNAFYGDMFELKANEFDYIKEIRSEAIEGLFELKNKIVHK